MTSMRKKRKAFFFTFYFSFKNDFVMFLLRKKKMEINIFIER